MAESDIARKIEKYLKSMTHCFFFKEHGGMYGTAGIPDIIICYHGRFVAMEVKTETGRTTKLQDLTIRKIVEAGGTAVVVRSVADVRRVLETLNT